MSTRSTIYSIGTALNRAADHDTPVEVMVGSAWIRGDVAGVDGHGLVLEVSPDEHVVVRLDVIQAVRVHASVPADGEAPAETEARPAGPVPSTSPAPPAPEPTGGLVPTEFVMPAPEHKRVQYLPAFKQA